MHPQLDVAPFPFKFSIFTPSFCQPHLSEQERDLTMVCHPLWLLKKPVFPTKL